MPYLPMSEAVSPNLMRLYNAEAKQTGDGQWEVEFPDMLNAAFWAQNLGGEEYVSLREDCQDQTFDWEVTVIVDGEGWDADFAEG
jgi:hypothetical protein